MTTEPGWESVIVRYSTFLLLTYIADSLLLKTPSRVDQDVLNKAISSGNNARELYNNLLLKHANDWNSVKSNALSGETDQAASNAHEVTQMLWKVYRRSRDHVSTKQTSDSRTKKHRKKKNSDRTLKRKKTVSLLEKKVTEGGKSDTGIIVNPGESSKESHSSSISPKGIGDPLQAAEESDLTEKSVDIENASSFTAGENPKGGDDSESLEEGEIRDSLRGSPKKLGVTVDDFRPIDEIASELSSSEGEMDASNTQSTGVDRLALPHTAMHHQYYQHHPAIYNGYHQNGHFQNFQIPVPTHIAPQQIQSTEFSAEPPVTMIELSDEEPIPEEEHNDDYIKAYDAIINVSSDEDSVGSRNPALPLHQCHGKADPLRFSPEQEKRKERQDKHDRRKDELHLINAEEHLINWPTGIVKSGPDKLWKWWRSHIEGNNGSIALSHQGFGQIHGVIPSLATKKRGNVVLPKIVDDIHQFLKCLEKTEFPQSCPRLATGAMDTSPITSNRKPVKTTKLLSLAEELSRGSVKRINFEISKRKTSFLTASNRITIKEFASIRYLTAKTTKKPDFDVSSEPKASSSVDYYSYGEPTNDSSMPSTNKAHGPSHSQWTTVSETGNRQCNGKNTSKDLVSPSGCRTGSSSYAVSKRKNSLTEGAIRERKSVRSSSSSSDRSLYSDRSEAERNRSTDRSRKRDSSSKIRGWYRDRGRFSDSSQSPDSSPQRRNRASRHKR